MREGKSEPRATMLLLAAWVFALEYSLYLIGDDFLDKLIKSVAVVALLALLRYRRDSLPGREKVLLTLFYALVCAPLIPSIFVGDPATGVSQWMKIALMTLIFPLLLVNRRLTPRNAELLTSVFLWLGVAFSIQAILAFLAVLGGIVDTPSTVDIGSRRPDLTEATLGLLGYANAIRSASDTTSWLRPQGWFLEPSLLGAFLLLPAFVSLGRFLQYRKTRYLLAFGGIFAAIFVTVSLAAYLGLTIGLFFFILSRPLHRRIAGLSRMFEFAYPLPILGAFLGVALLFIGLANSAAQVNVAELDEQQAVLTTVYARDPNGDSGNLFREVAKADIYVGTILSNPLGIGFAATLGENEILAPNGVLFWGVAGGMPALALLITLFGYIFCAFCHPLLISENPLHRCIAASFIGHAVHNLSYGNWLAPHFLIHLVIVCLAAREVQRATAPATAPLQVAAR